MAQALAYTFEDSIMEFLLSGAPLSSPGTAIWLALYTSNPGPSDTGTEVSLSSTGYARIQVTAWDAASNGVKQNTNAIEFGAATTNWGTITHIALRTASTGGSLMWYGALTTPRTVNSGDFLRLLAGEVKAALHDLP